MSTLEKNLYKNLKLKSPRSLANPIIDKSYKGLSTVNPDAKTSVLSNVELIKQDIVNHFHIRLGEKLENFITFKVKRPSRRNVVELE